MSLNVDRYRTRHEQLSSRRGGDFNQLKDGSNIVRLFTFEHKVTDEDYRRGLYSKDIPAMSPKIGSTQTELDREQYKHFMGPKEAPVSCSRTPDCPYCLKAKQLKGKEGKTDQEAGKRLSLKVQHVVNALVQGKDSSGTICMLTLPTSVFTDILGYVASPDYDANSLFGCEGRDFAIQRDSKKDPSKMYQVRLRDREVSAKLPKELLEQVHDLYNASELDGSSKAPWDEPQAKETSVTQPEHVEKATPDTAEVSAGTEFKDAESTGPDSSLIGKIINFKDDTDKMLSGKIVGTDKDGGYEVKDEHGDDWILERAEFELVESKKPAAKRKKS